MRMQAEDLKGWIAATRRGEKERKAATKDGGGKENTENAGRKMRRTGRGWSNWYRRRFGTGT